MSSELVAVAVAGALGIAGTIVGIVMTTWLGRSLERQRLSAEDDRRWLADRRTVYSSFLTLAESMLRDVDSFACFLSYDGVQTVADEDEEFIAEGLLDYFKRWDTELQPVLGDVQLLAGAEVADLADRVSGALMQITGVIEQRRAFVEYYPGWFRAGDLLAVLRNAMRSELGLKDEIHTYLPRSGDWPWLEGRPSEEDYVRRQLDIPGRPPLTATELSRLNHEE